MSGGALSWRQDGETLALSGALDRDSLMALWDDRHTVLAGITRLDLSALQRVDSTGLAMLVHLQNEPLQPGRRLALIGATDRLQTLIALYNLRDVVVTEDVAR